MKYNFRYYTSNNQLGLKISNSALYDLATLRNSVMPCYFLYLIILDYRNYILKSIRNILTNENVSNVSTSYKIVNVL